MFLHRCWRVRARLHLGPTTILEYRPRHSTFFCSTGFKEATQIRWSISSTLTPLADTTIWSARSTRPSAPSTISSIRDRRRGVVAKLAKKPDETGISNETSGNGLLYLRGTDLLR